MDKIKEFQEELINRVHLELTGHLDLNLNRSHFERLQIKTGASVRKLKELFGIYSKRSKMSHEYTLSKLAQYIGFEDWNSFVKSEMKKLENQKIHHNPKPIRIKQKIAVNPRTDKNVTISIRVRGRSKDS